MGGAAPMMPVIRDALQQAADTFCCNFYLVSFNFYRSCDWVLMRIASCPYLVAPNPTRIRDQTLTLDDPKLDLNANLCHR